VFACRHVARRACNASNSLTAANNSDLAAFIKVRVAP